MNSGRVAARARIVVAAAALLIIGAIHPPSASAGTSVPHFAATLALAAGSNPVGRVDAMKAQGAVVTVTGWAGDVDATSDQRVHLYVDGKARKAISTTEIRSDVKRAYPNLPLRTGFRTTVSVPDGTHTLCLYAINQGGGKNTTLACRAIKVDIEGDDGFRAAMNNDGISSDSGPRANIGPSATYQSLSAQALDAAGMAPGDKKTLNGATFTMPAPLYGYDNVIATGQTIPVAPIPGATNVDLLVLASCGNLRLGSFRNFTLSHENLSVSTRIVPTVNDWVGTPLTETVTQAGQFTRYMVPTLPYRNVGTKRVTGPPGPTLYHLKLPLAYSSPLAYITLPETGADLTNSCTTSLHILAVTTS